MKRKSILLVALLSLTVLISACGGSNNTKTTDKETESTTAEETESENSQEAESEPDDEKIAASAIEKASEEIEKAEAAAETESGDNSIELGKPITLGDYEVTIKEFSIVQTYDENPCLKVVYDWTNNSDEAIAPFISVSFKGFQDGVETDSLMLMADDVDLGTGQKEAKPGATISDAEYAIGIADMSKPLEFEVSEMFSFKNEVYTYMIDDLNSLN